MLATKLNFFIIKQIQTLLQKHPGWGIRLRSFSPFATFLRPFCFIFLRIPFLANLSFAHLYKTPGVSGASQRFGFALVEKRGQELVEVGVGEGRELYVADEGPALDVGDASVWLDFGHGA